MTDDPIEFRVLNEIGIIAQLAEARFEALAPDGMPLAQFRVLNHFARLGGERPMARLAASFQVTKGAMTNTVGRLAEKGFVRVRQDPGDGRVKLVSITEAGLAAREVAVAALGKDLARLRDAFGSVVFASLLPRLEALRTWLDVNR